MPSVSRCTGPGGAGLGRKSAPSWSAGLRLRALHPHSLKSTSAERLVHSAWWPLGGTLIFLRAPLALRQRAGGSGGGSKLVAAWGPGRWACSRARSTQGAAAGCGGQAAFKAIAGVLAEGTAGCMHAGRQAFWGVCPPQAARPVGKSPAGRRERGWPGASPLLRVAEAGALDGDEVDAAQDDAVVCVHHGNLRSTAVAGRAPERRHWPATRSGAQAAQRSTRARVSLLRDTPMSLAAARSQPGQ